MVKTSALRRAATATLSLCSIAAMSLVAGAPAHATPATPAGVSAPTKASDGWGPLLTGVRTRYMARPYITSAGHVAVLTWRHDNYFVSWKAAGEDKWGAKVPAISASRDLDGDVEVVVTSPSRVTLVWKEAVSGGVQHFTRWFDVDGDRGPIREAGPVGPAGLSFSEVVAGPGTIAIMSGTNDYQRVVLSRHDGVWAVHRDLDMGGFADVVAVNAAGEVTVDYRTSAGPGLQVWVATSTGDGPWRKEQVGPRAGSQIDLWGAGVSGPTGHTMLWWWEGQTVVTAYRDPDADASWTVEPLRTDVCPDGDHICANSTLGIDAAGDVTAYWTPSGSDPERLVDVDVARRDHESGTWSPTQTLLTDVPRESGQVWLRHLDVAPSGWATVLHWNAQKSSTIQSWRCPPGPDLVCTPAANLPSMPHLTDLIPVVGPDGSTTLAWMTSDFPDGHRRVVSRTLAPSSPQS